MRYAILDLKDHDGYSVRSDGAVYSRKQKPGTYTLLKPFFNGDRICVKIDGKIEGVARIVAKTFNPNHHDSRKYVIHMDGNVANNNAENLMWVDSYELRKLGEVSPKDRELYLMALRGEYYDDYVDPDDEETDEEEDDSE